MAGCWCRLRGSDARGAGPAPLARRVRGKTQFSLALPFLLGRWGPRAFADTLCRQIGAHLRQALCGVSARRAQASPGTACPSGREDFREVGAACPSGREELREVGAACPLGRESGRSPACSSGRVGILACFPARPTFFTERLAFFRELPTFFVSLPMRFTVLPTLFMSRLAFFRAQPT